MDDDIIKLRKDYAKAKAAATKASQTELETRHALIRAAFPEGETWEGTRSYDCADGVAIKVAIAYNYKIILEDETEVNEALTKLPDHVRDGLVDYKPKLSVSAYRKLSKPHQKIVDTILEIKPGSPQVKLS